MASQHRRLHRRRQQPLRGGAGSALLPGGAQTPAGVTLLELVNQQSVYGASEARTPSGWSPAGCGPHPPPLVATSPQRPLARPRSGTSPSWASATAPSPRARAGDRSGPGLGLASRGAGRVLGDPIDHPSKHWKCRKNRSYRPHASQVVQGWVFELDVAPRRSRKLSQASSPSR